MDFPIYPELLENINWVTHACLASMLDFDMVNRPPNGAHVYFARRHGGDVVYMLGVIDRICTGGANCIIKDGRGKLDKISCSRVFFAFGPVIIPEPTLSKND